jgi:uncharacterized protein
MIGGNLVIYHGGCADGFCAAWLLRKHLPADTEFIPANYGEEPPQVEGRHVYIVDFSYPRVQLEEVYKQAESLVVLDHHKTAREALEGLPYCRFDVTKSGARMTHEYCCEKFKGQTRGRPVPANWLVDYTEDRDLWTWELADSREINAALRSYGFDFEVWDELAKIDIDDSTMIAEGRAILRDQQLTVQAKVDQSHIVCVPKCLPIGNGELIDRQWRVANCTTLVSETCQALAGKDPQEANIGCGWFELPSGERVYSLRTCDEGTDVSEIAKTFGGGGHPRAAGFKARIHPWRQRLGAM